MFRELLTRVPDIHGTADPVRLQSMFINGIKHLPVAFTPGGRVTQLPYPRSASGRCSPGRRAATATASQCTSPAASSPSPSCTSGPARSRTRWAARGSGAATSSAVHLPNCPQYPIAYYGILLAGATFSPANPLLPRRDLAAQLADCGAVAVLTWGPAAPALGRGPRPHRRATGAADRPRPGPRPGAPGRDRRPRRCHRLRGLHRRRPHHRPGVAVDAATDLAHLAYTGGHRAHRRACSCRTATSWSTRCSTRCCRLRIGAGARRRRRRRARPGRARRRVPGPARNGRRGHRHAVVPRHGHDRRAQPARPHRDDDGAARTLRTGRPTSPTSSASVPRRSAARRRCSPRCCVTPTSRPATCPACANSPRAPRRCPSR